MAATVSTPASHKPMNQSQGCLDCLAISRRSYRFAPPEVETLALLKMSGQGLSTWLLPAAPRGCLALAGIVSR